MKIGPKMILFSTLPTLAALILLLFIQILIVNQQTETQIAGVRKQQEEAVVEKLKGEIDVAVNIVNNLRKSEKSKEECKDVIKNLRFGETQKDYVWIHSYNTQHIDKPEMVMHPALPNLDGKDISDFKDLERFENFFYRGKKYPKGAPELSGIPVTNLFSDMNRVCNKSGEGVVRYYWNKPGEDKDTAFSKFSYVKLIPEWGWVLGTGAYADHIDVLVADMEKEILSNKKRLINSTLALAAILITVLAVIISLFARKMTGTIKNLTDAAKCMAKGDTQKMVEITSRDELGQMADAFKNLTEVQRERATLASAIAKGDLTMEVELASDVDTLGNALRTMNLSLNEIVSELNLAAQQVDTGARQVSDSSQSLSQGATEQAASLEEITSSMTEIGAQTNTSAENASQANQLAIAMRETGQSGTQQMKEMVIAMKAISDASKEINKIIKTIDDIAFQTNLLALNAAVEAARAGKHGKGFAVVAQEVRTLAARSAKAAQETAELIESAIKKVDDGNIIAEKTADALNEINNGVGKVADLVGEIAVASNEQAQGISQANQGLSQIDSVTQQNTANAEETSAASEELSSQATMVRELLKRFKLKERATTFQPSISQKSKKHDPIFRKTDMPHSWGNPATTHQKQKTPSPEQIIALDDNDFGKY
jgi:methyl-accepting chemotaxis protein